MWHAFVRLQAGIGFGASRGMGNTWIDTVRHLRRSRVVVWSCTWPPVSPLLQVCKPVLPLATAGLTIPPRYPEGQCSTRCRVGSRGRTRPGYTTWLLKEAVAGVHVIILQIRPEQPNATSFFNCIFWLRKPYFTASTKLLRRPPSDSGYQMHCVVHSRDQHNPQPIFIGRKSTFWRSGVKRRFCKERLLCVLIKIRQTVKLSCHHSPTLSLFLAFIFLFLSRIVLWNSLPSHFQ